MADIIIKSANKGGGIVLQNRGDYNITEAERLLSDRATNSKLKKDPTSDFAHKVDILVKLAFDKGIIYKIEASFFRKNFYQIPFYHLPKIHKNSTSPPCRPIVATIDSVTTGFSQYIDQYLQPLVH